MNKIVEIMLDCGADSAAQIKLSNCEIINQKLIDKLQFVPQSLFIGTIPYYTHYCDKDINISAYAIARDYHIYIKNLGETIIRKAKEFYPNANFACFGDHSPINEKLAAAAAGLGIIGKHSLLITPDRSSFVFLFEIICDIPCYNEAQKIQHCSECGKCIQACPIKIGDPTQCLSAITQKKNELSEFEEKLIKKAKCAWGCDICQKACPHTQDAINRGTIYATDEWFNTNILSEVTYESLECKEDFNTRAYSWRGIKTIKRNLDIINSNKR